MATPRPRRLVAGVVALALAVLLALGVVSGAFSTAATRVLYGTGLWVDGGASTVSPGTFDEPTPTAAPTTEPPSAPPPVLPAATSGPEIDPQGLAARIAAVDRTDVGRVGGVVFDGTGGVLYDSGGNTPMIPASTMKLLTAVGVLDTLGPGHRFTTSVVRATPAGADAPPHLVLVGGGDPYLLTRADPDHPNRASLELLAKEVADALKTEGVTTVTVGHDATLFAGPGWNPTWPSRYGDEVAATNALWVDGARTEKRNPGPRDADPAAAATKAFVAELARAGITATAGAAEQAPADATPVAEVRSESLDVIVESVLRHSDNDATEVLFRHVGRADGRSGSIADAQQALRERLTELGVWVDGTRIVDGSGMSRENAIPARVVAGIVLLGLDDARPQFRSLLTGLPLAAADGSLRGRFFSPGTEAGQGVVRAKTGTLTKVHALGGYTRTASGRTVAFAFIVNDGEPFPDRVFLDRVTSAVTACGC
ncbi:D-alanyl-D-alanine carboxypeptidase/D-alanyl-D-alanine endopeptidase [Propionibacteriaceae bacterium Y2011]